MSSDPKRRKKEPRWIKAVTEYLPLILFLIAYFKFDLMVAIQVIVAATGVALVIALIVARRVPVLPLLVAGSVVLFGGIAWLTGSEDPYKMKPTILNGLFGVVLLGGLRFNRLFLKSLMEDSFQLPDAAWRTLTIRYSGLFFTLAIANEIVWRSFSDTVWVTFKIGGTIGAVLVFTAIQWPFIQRHMLSSESPKT